MTKVQVVPVLGILQRLIRFVALGLLLLAMMPSDANADKESQTQKRAIINQLKKLTLDDLVKVETFNPKGGLAGRKVQKLTDTAAALFVITQEDIRRAGITRLSEALRMVPGMQVARLDAHEWAISARGLNDRNASKLLVMMDGRTVYTPLRSDVNWDVQDTLIEDVERIEVIRGPGASLWGANAVNGIINIITKSAQDSQGNLITAHVGKGEARTIIGARHGGQFDNGAYYRIYGKFHEYDSFVDAVGQDQENEWQINRGGGRMDWTFSRDNTLTLQGDIYDGFAKRKALFFVPTPHIVDAEIQISGLNILARWQRLMTNGDVTLQTYYNLSRRDEVFYDEFRGTYDIDFQHRIAMSERLELIWGLGFRHTYDDLEGSSTIIFTPQKRQDSLFSAFVQSEFKMPLNFSWGKNEPNPLEKNELRLILGSKFEHNDYSGFEIQPTLRLLWDFNDKHNLWAAISRAVRTPSRSDEDITVQAMSADAFIIAQGNPDIQSEVLLAYELGYRFNLTNQFLLDTSVFYNDYDKLRTNELINVKPFPPPLTLFLEVDNQLFGEVYGLELATHWQVTPAWKLIGTYSYLDTQLHLKPTSNDAEAELLENNSPHHQASLRSLLTWSPTVELDTALYYVDNVPNQPAAHYTRFDARLGWQPQPALELSVGVRNLLDNQHREFGSGIKGTPANEVSRAFYLQLNYQF